LPFLAGEVYHKDLEGVKDGSEKKFYRIALDIRILFADNNLQHPKGDDRGKYVSESRQRRGSTG
jgi:hypothetical protein